MMTRPKQLLHGAALALAIFLLIGAGDPATRFNELGHQMMCICSCNQILLECNHVGCPDSDRMRNELMAAVTRGDSDSLVEQAFVQKYGPTVLAAPTKAGFDRVAWIIPFVALALGLGIVVMVVRGWKNGGPPPGSAGGGPGRDSLSRPPGSGPKMSRAEFEKFREQAREETEI